MAIWDEIKTFELMPCPEGENDINFSIEKLLRKFCWIFEIINNLERRCFFFFFIPQNENYIIAKMCTLNKKPETRRG